MVEAVKKSMVVPAVTRSLKDVRDFVQDTLLSAPLDEKGRRFVILGIDEAVTNFVTHRAAGPTEADIAIRIDIDDVRVRVVIEDRGVDPDPGPLALPDLEKFLREGRTRCVGTFLICQVMDEVTFRYKKGFQNELELIKFTS